MLGTAELLHSCDMSGTYCGQAIRLFFPGLTCWGAVKLSNSACQGDTDAQAHLSDVFCTRLPVLGTLAFLCHSLGYHTTQAEEQRLYLDSHCVAHC